MKRYGNTLNKKQSVVDYLMWAQDQRYASDQLYRHNMAQPTTSTMLTKNVDGNIRLLHGNNSALQNMPYSSTIELNVVNAINIVNSQSHHSILPTFTQKYELIHRENEKKMIIDAVNKLNNGENNLIALITKLIEFKTDYLYKFQQEIIGIRDWNILNDCQKIISEEQTGIKWLQGNFHLKAKEFLKSDYVRKLGIEAIFHNDQENNQPNLNEFNLDQQDDEEEEMLQALKAQLEQLIIQMNEKEQLVDRITQERDNAIEQRDEVVRQLEEKDGIIEEKNNIISDQNEQNTELITEVNNLNNTVQNLQNTITSKDNQINELNTTVKDLREANVDSTPQIRNLEHRLEVVNIEKSALEQILVIREQQITGLQHDKIILEQSTIDLKEDKAELRAVKNELTAKNITLEQIKTQLTENISGLTKEIVTKDSKIEKIMMCYTDYETIMLGCSACNPHVHAVEFD